jgi:hypothetical protein
MTCGIGKLRNLVDVEVCSVVLRLVSNHICEQYEDEGLGRFHAEVGLAGPIP